MELNHEMLEQQREEFSSLVVDGVEDIVVNTDRNLIIIIDEYQLNEIINLDEVISLQIVHSTIPIDEKDVRQNLKGNYREMNNEERIYLEDRREDAERNNRKFLISSFSFVSKGRKVKEIERRGERTNFKSS